MLRNINATKQLVFTTCIAMTLVSMGCRSGRLGSSGLLGFGGQPSAEALAGNGPTTTYPAPPSESATPQAIASVAGGTIAPSTFGQNSIAQNSVAPTTPSYGGLDITPGKVSPVGATAPNTAASLANGFYGNTKPAGFSVPEIKTPQVTMPSAKMSAPSGYQFGSSQPAAAPAVSATPVNKTASATPAYALPKSIPSTVNKNGPQSNSFVVPDLPAAKTRLSENPGMSLPGDLAENIMASVPAAKSVFTPKAAPTENAPVNISLPSVQMGGNSGSPQINFTQGGLPQANIAAAPPAPPTVTPAATASPSWGGSSSGGYSPGSTSSGTGYPSGGYATPSTSGSFYR